MNRLQPQFLFSPSLIHSFVRCSVNALIGNSPDPLPKLAVEVAETTGLTTLHTTEEVSAYVLHAGLNLPLVQSRQLHIIRPIPNRFRSPTPFIPFVANHSDLLFPSNFGERTG